MITPEQIQELAAAARLHGVSIRLYPDGSVTVKPAAAPRSDSTPDPKKAAHAARMREYRATRAARDVTNVTRDAENVTRDATVEELPLPSPPSPTPPSPTPIPATKRAREASAIPELSADFQAACRVELEMMAPPALKHAWLEWQKYRQERHKCPRAADRIEWTEQAAKSSAQTICSMADTLGMQLVLDQIAAAIQGRWRGLNFHKISQNGPSQNHRPYQAQGDSRRTFSATRGPGTETSIGASHSGQV